MNNNPFDSEQPAHFQHSQQQSQPYHQGAIPPINQHYSHQQVQQHHQLNQAGQQQPQGFLQQVSGGGPTSHVSGVQLPPQQHNVINTPFSAAAAPPQQQQQSYQAQGNLSFKSSNNPFDVPQQAPLGYSNTSSNMDSSDSLFNSVSKPAPNTDVLNLFDPLSSPPPPKPIVPPSSFSSGQFPNSSPLSNRIINAQAAGLISTVERDKLIAKEATERVQIESALNLLERTGDRSLIYGLTIDPVGSQVNHEEDDSDSGDDSSSSGSEDSKHVHFSENVATHHSASRMSTSTLVDSDDEEGDAITRDYEVALKLQQELDRSDKFAVPHPAFGGFKEALPGSFRLESGVLMGSILIRRRSKKLFRKWAPVYFVLNKDRLCVYETRSSYETGGPPRYVYRIHPCMYVRTPTLKMTYSMMDDGRQVYYSTFKENETEAGSSKSWTGKYSSQNKFSLNLPVKKICKFGAGNLAEIRAFSHALYGVVKYKQIENSIRMTRNPMNVTGRYD